MTNCGAHSTALASILRKTCCGVSATWSIVAPSHCRCCASSINWVMPAICVLGNHDLHLLALVAGNEKHKDESSLDAVMAASDRDELLHWLRHRPLIHHDPALDFLMVHAGLPPQWDLATALACGREVEAVLRGADHVDYFMHMYGNKARPLGSGADRHGALAFHYQLSYPPALRRWGVA